MSQSKEEGTAQPSMLARAEEIQQQIQQLCGGDLQLWSIGLLIILVLTPRPLALLLPNLVWSHRAARIKVSHLPQLFFGLLSLILLFNISLLRPKLPLNT